MDGEAGGVVICAYAHPAQIVVDVVDAIGNGAGELGIDEVVHINDLRLIFTTLFRAAFLKLPTKSFFFVSTEMTGSSAVRKSTA